MFFKHCCQIPAHDNIALPCMVRGVCSNFISIEFDMAGVTLVCSLINFGFRSSVGPIRFSLGLPNG